MSKTDNKYVTTIYTSSTGLEGYNVASNESFETKSKNYTGDTSISETENMITDNGVII